MDSKDKAAIEVCWHGRCGQGAKSAPVAFGGSARQVETGLWRSMRPALDISRCTSCLRCWIQCPDLSVVTDGDVKVTGINLYFCKGCGLCAQVCPVKAITMRAEADCTDKDSCLVKGEDIR